MGALSGLSTLDARLRQRHAVVFCGGRRSVALPGLLSQLLLLAELLFVSGEDALGHADHLVIHNRILVAPCLHNL